MTVVTNGRVLFNSIPEGYPEPGKSTIYDTTQQIDIDTVPLDGGFLVKTLVLSVDPYMRGKMRSSEIKSYSDAYVIGEPLNGYAVGVVVRSESTDVKAGDHVYGNLAHQEYIVRQNMNGLEVMRKNEHNLPWSVFVGAAGMPGKTAYMGWKEFSRAKKGEIVFVTAGAGPVGSFVIQLAKREGLKVIASAGSEDKLQFMKEVGADVVFNYKTTDTNEVLAKEGPIDIYWDNVGGPSLDAALEAAANYARFIMCGFISGYNATSFGDPEYGNKKLYHVFGKSLSFNGFVVSRLMHNWNDEFYNIVPGMISRGEILYREDVSRGLDKVGDVILAVQKGLNTGKAAVIVAED